jgi:hypothetical protein
MYIIHSIHSSVNLLDFVPWELVVIANGHLNPTSYITPLHPHSTQFNSEAGDRIFLLKINNILHFHMVPMSKNNIKINTESLSGPKISKE